MTNQLSDFDLADIESAFNGKMIAFTPVFDGSLGVAVANEKGYSPIGKNMYLADDDRYDTASTEADRLNEKLGLTDEVATKIIITTMFAG